MALIAEVAFLAANFDVDWFRRPGTVEAVMPAPPRQVLNTRAAFVGQNSCLFSPRAELYWEVFVNASDSLIAVLPNSSVPVCVTARVGSGIFASSRRETPLR